MINILMCGNDKVFDGMIIELLSLVKFNKHQVKLYLITMDLVDYNPKFKPITSKQKEVLEDILKRGNCDSTIELLDYREEFLAIMKDSPNMQNFYTPYTLLRLFADYLPSSLDRILYLDCDLVMYGDIKPLYDFDIEGVEYAGAIDVLGQYFISNIYTNAGVLLFNLAECRKTQLFEKCRDLLSVKKMAFSDQDALNHLVTNKKFFPYIYNVQRNFKKGTVIKHFCKTIRWLPFYHTSNIKSWNIEGVHNTLKCHSYDDILDEYQTIISNFKD